MATLTSSLALSSSAADIFSDAISVTLADTASITDNVSMRKHKITGTDTGNAIKILEADDFARSIVIVKNLGVTGAAAAGDFVQLIVGSTTDSDVNNMGRLDATEMFMSPLNANQDIYAYATRANTVIEVFIFELS